MSTHTCRSETGTLASRALETFNNAGSRWKGFCSSSSIIWRCCYTGDELPFGDCIIEALKYASNSSSGITVGGVRGVAGCSWGETLESSMTGWVSTAGSLGWMIGEASNVAATAKGLVVISVVAGESQPTKSTTSWWIGLEGMGQSLTWSEEGIDERINWEVPLGFLLKGHSSSSSSSSDFGIMAFLFWAFDLGGRGGEFNSAFFLLLLSFCKM